MKYGKLSLGQVEAIVNKLGGMDGVDRLLSGELVVRAAERRTFSVWRTIRFGFNGTSDFYRNALQASGYLIGDYGYQILKKVEVSRTPIEVDLVVMTVAELGFKNGACRNRIYGRAQELGLQLCPAEVGPALRLAYKDQPYQESLVVGHDPILLISGGGWLVFELAYDHNGWWLHVSSGDPDSFWSPGCRIVFVLPRKTA